MKVFSAIVKIIAAAAFIAGVVYLVATYGDKIVAWARKVLPCMECKTPAADAEIVDAPAEEAPVAEAEAAEETPVAEDVDFAE